MGTTGLIDGTGQNCSMAATSKQTRTTIESDRSIGDCIRVVGGCIRALLEACKAWCIFAGDEPVFGLCQNGAPLFCCQGAWGALLGFAKASLL